MKNYTNPQVLRLRRIFYFCSPAALLSAILITISTATVSGQSIPASASELSAVGVLANQWKSTEEYTAVINALQNENTIILAQQNLHGPDLALYTGYGRLLNYIRKDLLEHLPVDNLADKNYKKVITESSSDPELQGMPIESFTSLYNTLVERLHQ
jgi:uncharacterized membrane protein